MKLFAALSTLLLSTPLAGASETPPRDSGFLSLIGGGYTQVTDEETQLFALPYFELYCAGLIKVTPFEAGLTQTLTDGGEFRAELMVNWENVLEDWLDEDDLNAELDTIASLGGEALLGFTMLEYRHSVWLNDLENQQATHLGLFVPVPLKGESLMVMPSIGADFWSAGRTQAELELANGTDAIVPYAGLTFVSALGEDMNVIAHVRQQFLPDPVTDLSEVNTDRRQEFILALEYHF